MPRPSLYSTVSSVLFDLGDISRDLMGETWNTFRLPAGAPSMWRFWTPIQDFYEFNPNEIELLGPECDDSHSLSETLVLIPLRMR